jgi:O-antigen biosynthesis protein
MKSQSSERARMRESYEAPESAVRDEPSKAGVSSNGIAGASANGVAGVSASGIIERLDLRKLAAHRHAAGARPSVRGKFFYVGEDKLYVKGITYGTFRPNRNGERYPEPEVVARDFKQMAASGINTVRTYVLPPRWLLDLAQKHGLRVIVGILWEQYECLPADARRVRAIRARVRAAVESCARHPAVLAYSIGNEIPASIVRWHGAARVEKLLHQLYLEVKKADPEALVTYVNYPTTEYLDLRFLDFVSFNVYLESRTRLESYLARLQNLAGDRPLVLAEIGLDSQRNGERGQAETLDWQVRAAFAAGCAGAFVFAWTDEWHCAGVDIGDWDFGVVRRDRQPKEALAAVRRVFGEVPFAHDVRWPRISVVVCSYNGSATIRSCLEGLERLEYPNHEVIVVNDGSTDATGAIAREFDFRLIETPNRGLSSARNTGIAAAEGEIVAFVDDDAWPDPHWLHYVAQTFITTDHVAVGGPNVAPSGDGSIADSVANAPGGPVHVLLSDQEAEHIPGCNMSFRKSALIAVGGFDPQFRVAGDDVDICWKLQQQGWTIGFHAAAMIWHRRRNSVRRYWKQQQGYGRAEAMLVPKWPEKYNLAGHATWSGRLYGPGVIRALAWRPRRIYHGSWGSAPFQSVYQRAPDGMGALLLMPESYLGLGALAILAGFGLFWPPMLLVLPAVLLGVGATLVQALVSAKPPSVALQPGPGKRYLKLWALCTALHLLQPAARLWGRLQHGLAPWRTRGTAGLGAPVPRTISLWTEVWRAPEEMLRCIEARFRDEAHFVRRGGDFDRWDLEGWGGPLGSIRTLMVVEEHGNGKQLIRFRITPRPRPLALALPVVLAGAGLAAFGSGAPVTATVLAALATILVLGTLRDCATATGAMLQTIRSYAGATSAGIVGQAAPRKQRNWNTLLPRVRPARAPGIAGD